jgi:hypothetical protein
MQVLLEQAPEVSQEQVVRYLHDLWLTEYRAEFRFYTFDVKQAWSDAIRAWWEGKRSPLIDILGPVKEALSWFWNSVLRPPLEAMFRGLGWIVDRVKDAVAALLQPIRATLSWIWEKVGALGEWIFKRVEGALEWVWGRIQQGLSWVWEKVSSGLGAISGALSWLWEQVSSGLKWIYEGIAATMSRIAEYIISGLKGALEIFRQLGEWIVEGIRRLIVDPIVSLVNAAISAIAAVGESIRSMIMAPPETASPIRIEGTTRRVMGILAGGFGAWGLTEASIHMLNVVHPIKNMELRQTRDEVMHYAGYHALLSAFQSTWFAVTVTRPLTYELNARFMPAVPDPRDILEMYSRAKLPRDRVRSLMRYHGYGPEYDEFWDELKNAPLRYFALNAISRAGLFDEAVFKEELDRCGYSERAKELLMKAFRIGEMTAEVREGFGALRKLLKEGFRTEEEALAMWEEFRAETDPIARQLIVARWEYEYDYKSDLRALILDQFERGLLDRARAFSALSEIMPIAARVNTLLDRAELRVKVEKVPEPKEKALTKSEILSAYKNEIITLEEAVERLRAMRYADEDIQILIALNMPKPKRK